jgi:hypothetical protein
VHKAYITRPDLVCKRIAPTHAVIFDFLTPVVQSVDSYLDLTL